ncbi:helix-turn-helix transcriptional regulator [Streptomyces halstedii]|uniref:helix-turn-helix transcriptional regulator n=1 Tax=Streptomyces TaxID=1883 RepID=UPI000805CB7F|nr:MULTISPECIES: YafY family protein [Streptomyces]MYR75294.1 WYL domain-containing protein [Streptomyces sp. SID4925]SBU87915.1 Predicted DNA-binding transcriptional regulator YafY, contains an HTH and WYL domains [Streptomyces sp. OspMP-M45]
MLETSARLLRLLTLLQSPRAWPGTELADRLGVSGRTVRNDIERLRTLGYPVDATRGSAGGYRLAAGSAMPPLLLEDDEAVAVTLAVRTVAQSSMAGTEETSLRALAKLEQVLPARLRRRVKALQEYTAPVPADRPGPTVDTDLLMTLTAACRDHERLRLDYRDHAGASTRRLVEPQRVVNWGRRWYLVAWDVDRDDWRTFRADRITPRTPAGPRFAPRGDPEGDAAAYVAGKVSAAAWRHHTRVTVHAPAATVLERINPAVGVVEAVDGRTCVLVTGADTLESLAVHLSVLGCDFTVTEPPELVAYLRELAGRYARSTPAAAPLAPGAGAPAPVAGSPDEGSSPAACSR